MYQTGLQVFVSTQQVPALVFIRVPLQSFCRHIYDKHLLFLLSRHHILEIITAAVFDLFFKSSGPQIAIFSRFKEQWKFIDTTKFRTIDAPAIGVKSELTGYESGLLNEKRKDIIGFLQNELSQHLHWLPISTRIEYKVLLIVVKAQMGVALKYLRDAIRPLPHPFVLYVIAHSLWNCLLPSARASVLSSNLYTSLNPYHLLKLISFLRANRTKSASVCLWLLR